MNALDLVLTAGVVYIAWHVLKVLSGQGPASGAPPGGRMYYAGGGVNLGNAANADWPDLLARDWSAPGQTNFNRPPAGYVWNDPAGAYVLKDSNGALVGIYT